MKTRFIHLQEGLLTVALGLTFASMCGAQSTIVKKESVTTPSVGVEGTLRSSGPETLVIQKGEEQPLTYRNAQPIPYVDETGAVVRKELIVPGLPVTVEGIREGDNFLVKRVIVHQNVAKTTQVGPGGTTATTTTTTTTENVKQTDAEGVLGLWQPDEFELNTVKDGTLRFLFSKDTEIVDADHKHVDAIRMKPGTPVTVHFRQEGDRLMADRVTLNGRIVEVRH